ncbi:Thioredoxin-like fold [Pseudocohnilembus persalinus]|uniref:Thioredoxin-like fold n=1 Tax=Pseudocohnilembus persalinus TaxID=266149 RepID=A0A0V0QSW3_PSEPJ|nr:Thioredoxin-like fold [Pseudocohnilembus persalinus]|eukprot:KRX05449.1 Thioredoxin-like fold [Pseudocohnilembus persalinus]
MSDQEKTLLLGDEIPNFSADTTEGQIEFHKWLGESWGILFSHPDAFTPICTSELGKIAKLLPEFEKREVKVVAISCNDVKTHKDWIKDIEHYSKCSIKYPIIGDPDRKIAKKLGMLQTNSPKDPQGLPMTVRSVYVIGPDRKLQLSITYPQSCGRNFDEILRVIDSLQLSFKKKLATPADWKKGEDCIISHNVSDKQAEKEFQGFKTEDLPSGKSYMRVINPNDVEK